MTICEQSMKAMGEIFSVWRAKSRKEADANQKRYVAAKTMNTGAGWAPCNFKRAANEWPGNADRERLSNEA